MRELLRRCPSCGRRFTVRLQSRTLKDVQRDIERVMHDVVVVARSGRDARVIPVDVVFEDVPIEREFFDVVYECRNCRRRWTETLTKVEKR